MIYYFGKALLLFVFGTIAGVLFYKIYIDIIERKYGKYGNKGLSVKIQKIQKMRAKFILREENLSGLIGKNYSDLKKLRRKYFLLGKELEETKRQINRKNHINRYYMEDNPAYRSMSVKMDKYCAKVQNKNIEKLYAQGRRHAWLLPLWREPQEILVWASSVSAAKVELEKIYPSTLGFVILDVYIMNETMTGLIENSDHLDNKTVALALGMSENMRKDMQRAENMEVKK